MRRNLSICHAEESRNIFWYMIYRATKFFFKKIIFLLPAEYQHALFACSKIALSHFSVKHQKTNCRIKLSCDSTDAGHRYLSLNVDMIKLIGDFPKNMKNCSMFYILSLYTKNCCNQIPQAVIRKIKTEFIFRSVAGQKNLQLPKVRFGHFFITKNSKLIKYVELSNLTFQLR